jgi:hypothetical protein
MKFCCPECCREEEIVADRKPCCLVCRVGMVAASDYSQVWMSPAIAIIRMKTISETFGAEAARAGGRFKKEREAWATAVLALALSKLDGHDWWVEIETVENTPDTRLRRVESTSGHNVIQTRSIEVVDWEENVNDIMEVIRKKCERAYPSNYFLLVHARNVGKVLHFDRVVVELTKIRSPFFEVWVIASVGHDQMIAVRVAPGTLRVDLKLAAELALRSKQSAFLKKGMRGMVPGFQELGPSFLPIPGRD